MRSAIEMDKYNTMQYKETPNGRSASAIVHMQMYYRLWLSAVNSRLAVIVPLMKYIELRPTTCIGMGSCPRNTGLCIALNQFSSFRCR